MNRWLAYVTLTVVLSLSGATGCGRRTGGADGNASAERTLVFRFKSAGGLHEGAKVRALGTTVGRIMQKPEIVADGRSVLVTARVDGLSSDLVSLLNRRMTARVEKDSLVAGQVLLTLYFSDKPAPPLVAGEIIAGCDSFVELEAWKLLSTGTSGVSSFDRLMGLVFETDAIQIGNAIYWLNVAAFCTTILLILAMLCDFVLRVLQGHQRTRPSPRILVRCWQLFGLIALVKVSVVAVALVAWAGGFSLPDLRPWFVMPDNVVKLVLQDWRYLSIVITLAGLRFRFGLLSLVVRNLHE